MLKKLKNWRIGDYFRQFSIVTAGIVVTFVGSNLISQYSVNREIKSTMHLIIRELENNKADLELFIKKHANDRVMAQYLIDSKFDVSTIDADTLRKYSAFTSQLSSFQYSEDALDVLKGSSLMQQIEDKEILLSLIKTYQSFQSVKEGVREYYDLKRAIIVPIALSPDSAISHDVSTSYGLFLSDVKMQKFCAITIGFFSPNYLSGQVEQTEVLISQLRVLYD